MRREVMLLSAIAMLAACGGSADTATTTTGAALTDSANAATAADSAKQAADRIASPGARHAAIDTAALAGQRPMLRETYTYQEPRATRSSR